MKRREIVADGLPFEIVSYISSDFLKSHVALLPDIPIRITFHRSPPPFYMHTDADAAADKFEIVFDQALLHMNFVETTPEIRELHTKRHQKTPARYLMKKVTRRFESINLISNVSLLLSSR